MKYMVEIEGPYMGYVRPSRHHFKFIAVMYARYLTRCGFNVRLLIKLNN